jgi:hypothetical protein
VNTDLADIIAQATLRAYNAGYELGRSHVLDAVKLVQFEHYDLLVAGIEDLEEELKMRGENG